MAKLVSSLHEVAKFEIIRIPFDVTVIGEALRCHIDHGIKARASSIITHPTHRFNKNGLKISSLIIFNLKGGRYLCL